MATGVYKKYKVGIIPHYVDINNSWLKTLRNRDDIIVINFRSEVSTVVEQIKSCECILSSSLHGGIVADSFNIPKLFIQLGDRIKGGDFKFNDYQKSVGGGLGRLLVGENTMVDDLILQCKELDFNKEEMISYLDVEGVLK
jgi:pyruvyltransferase